MDVAALKLLLTADGSSVTKTLSDLQGQLKRFRDALTTATDINSIARLNRAIEATQQRINAIGNLRNFSNINNGFNELAKTSGRANQALVDVGRVVQDLPYAFYNVGAIANNLTPLVESLGRLRNEAAATGQTVGGALLQSITGTGGLIFGVSILSGVLGGLPLIMRAFGDSADKTNLSLTKQKDITGDLANNLDKYAKAIDYLGRLKGFDIQLAGGKNEKINDLANDVDVLNKKLIQFGRTDANFYTSQGFVNLLNQSEVELTKQRILLDAERNLPAGVETQKVKDEIKAINDAQEKALQKQSDLQDEINLKQRELINLRNEDAKKIKDVLAELEKQLSFLNKQAKIGFITTLELKQGSIDAYADAIDQLLKLGISTNDKIIKDLLAKYVNVGAVTLTAGKLATIKGKIEPLIKAEDLFPSKQALEGAQKKYEEDIKRLTESIKSRNAQAASEIAESNKQNSINIFGFISDLSNSISEGLGDVLAGGSFNNFVSDFGNIIGNFVKSIGKAAITVGLTMLKVKKALQISFSNPFAAIAIGIATIALGQLIQTSFSSIKAFAKGGLVTGKQLAILGDNPSGKEMALPWERTGEFAKEIAKYGGGGGAIYIENHVDEKGIYSMVKRGEDLYRR